jgi:ADP-ribosyl-[dinitrogen reductase] hydrolase
MSDSEVPPMPSLEVMNNACLGNRWLNHAWGAFVGSCIGDAAGAILEGMRPPISDRAINDACSFVGGGCHNVDPGAVTDDGELTCAALHALHDYSPDYEIPVDVLAEHYKDWAWSAPFDIGNTCRSAFRMPRSTPSEGIAECMRAGAAQHPICVESEANGSLMRASALGVWVSASATTSGTELARLAAEVAWADATLSHPSRVCVEAATLYVLAIAYLIRNPGDGLGALMAVEAELQERCTSDVVDWFYQSVSMDPSSADSNVCVNGGHVKHAFRLAFYHLRRRSTAEEAVRDVLRRGGDTDTNACIVGGLIGALHGYTLIPEHLKKRVLTFDCTKPHGLNHRRPHTYSVARCFRLVEHMAPLQEPVAAPSRLVHVMKMEGKMEDASVKQPATNSTVYSQDLSMDLNYSDDSWTKSNHGSAPQSDCRGATLASGFTTTDLGLDSVVSAIIQKFTQRAQFGKAKYGTDLDRTDLGVLDWIQHAQEEHMDAILYLEKLKRVVLEKNLGGAL